MTEKRVLVPDHIAAEVELEAAKANQEKKEKETKSEVDSAFVSPEVRVLDPTLMSKSLIDRMPSPSGWRMLILPYRGRGVSKGGITLVKDTVDREALASVVAYVVKMGPLCYKDKDKFGDTPWCQEKSWVLIGRYAGARFKLGDDAECRIINDDEVIATIADPDDIVTL
jgi:co-chaperonin GroES (HSP10)